MVVVVVLAAATAMVAAMVVVVVVATAGAVPATPSPRRGLTNVKLPFEIHPSESETRVVGRGVAAGASAGGGTGRKR